MKTALYCSVTVLSTLILLSSMANGYVTLPKTVGANHGAARASFRYPSNPQQLFHAPSGVATGTIFDLSPARLVQRVLTGKQEEHSPISIQGMTLTGLNYVLAAPLFAIFVNLWNKIFWRYHVALAKAHGVVLASFVTSAMGWLTIAPLTATLWMIPELAELREQKKTDTSQPKKQDKKQQFLQSVAPLNVLTVFANVAISAVSVILFTKRPEHMVSKRFAFGSSMFAWFFCSLVADIAFRTIHRSMHYPNSKHAILRWLAKKHKVHHGVGGNKDMVPVKAAHNHPMDFVLSNLPVVLGPILLGAHPTAHFAFHHYAAIAAVGMHSRSFPIDLGYHSLHHEHANCNYGLLGIADRIAGTTH